MCPGKLLQVVRSSPNNKNNLSALLMLLLPFSAPSHLSCSTRQQAVLPVLDTPVLSFPCQMHLSWAADRPGLLTTCTVARALASSKFMLCMQSILYGDIDFHLFVPLFFFAYIPNVTYSNVTQRKRVGSRAHREGNTPLHMYNWAIQYGQYKWA